MLGTLSDYQVNNILVEAKNSAEEYEALAQAFRSIKRLAKKDGSDFSIMSKNFEGCYFRDPRYTKSHANEKEIFVYTQTKSGRYVNAYIDNYAVVKYSDIKPDESRIIKESFYEPYFYYNANELQKLFEATAKKYDMWAANARKKEQTIKQAAEIYNNAMIDLNRKFKELNIPFDVWDLQQKR